MKFQDIYESLIECIGSKDVNIYIHILNTTEQDLEYIKNLNDNRVKIIKAETLEQFFLDAFDVDLVLSVDSAIHHFREGIEKPSIGLYGPFPMECRNKYFRYTKSINIKSDCPNMPCFIHVRKANEICNFQQKLHDEKIYDEKNRMVAPCCCNDYNKTVKEQIINECKSYINDII